MFNKFPYTDFHEMNLDYILNKIQELSKEWKDFKITGELKYAEPIEWNQLTYYPRYTVVLNPESGDSYLSKKDVPSGVSLYNNEFWYRISYFNAQIGDLEEKIEKVQQNLDGLWSIVYPSMSQTEIQEVINNNYNIKFDKGIYEVEVIENYDYGFTIPSNRTIWLNNSTIKLKPSSVAAYEVIKIDGADNVKIYDGIIEGDKYDHTTEGGEWGDCILISESKNVTLDNLTLRRGWGDGLEVYTVNGLYVNNCNIEDNRRNGISIISGTEIIIESSIFDENGGIAPHDGIDIETNNTGDILGNININNCIFKNTLGVSININSHKSGNIEVNNCTCDKSIAYGDLDNNASVKCKINNCTCSRIGIDVVNELSYLDINDCSIIKSSERLALAVAYATTSYNINIYNLLIMECDNAFLYSLGNLYNCNIDINIINSSFITYESGNLINTNISVNNNKNVVVRELTAPLMYYSTYIIDNESPTNAISLNSVNGLSMGKEFIVINNSNESKNIIDMPIRVISNSDNPSVIPANSTLKIRKLNDGVELVYTNSISSPEEFTIITPISLYDHTRMLINENTSDVCISFNRFSEIPTNVKYYINNIHSRDRNFFDIPSNVNIRLNNINKVYIPSNSVLIFEKIDDNNAIISCNYDKNYQLVDNFILFPTKNTTLVLSPTAPVNCFSFTNMDDISNDTRVTIVNTTSNGHNILGVSVPVYKNKDLSGVPANCVVECVKTEGALYLNYFN